MADIKNAAPTEEYNDDGSNNPDYVAPTGAGEGGAGASDTKNDDANKGGEGADDKGDENPFDDNADPVIPVRNSVAQHIIARKNKQIEKLKSKDENAGGDGTTTPPADENKSDLTDEARSAISKELDERLAPVVETLVSQADEKELKDLFTSEPEAKKYEKHIKAYMGHESYKGVSPVVIYHHLAFNSALAAGAKKKQAADLAAKQNKGGGNGLPPKNAVSVDNLPTAEDIEGMSEDDFAKMEEDARQGKFTKK